MSIFCGQSGMFSLHSGKTDDTNGMLHFDSKNLTMKLLQMIFNVRNHIRTYHVSWIINMLCFSKHRMHMMNLFALGGLWWISWFSIGEIWLIRNEPVRRRPLQSDRMNTEACDNSRYSVTGWIQKLVTTVIRKWQDGYRSLWQRTLGSDRMDTEACDNSCYRVTG